VQLDRLAADDGRFRVRFRPRDDSDKHELATVHRLDQRNGRLVAWVPPAQVANDKVCYQIGVATGLAVMYEPWSCLPLRMAAR
jgi:hypothetical protein